jgi:large-conductance mechanosensitive channel
LSANTTLTESLADTAFNAAVNNPECGFVCSLLTPYSRGKFFTSFEWFIMDFVLSLLLMMFVIFIIVIIWQRMARQEAMVTAETGEFKKEEDLLKRIAVKRKTTDLVEETNKTE